MSSQNARNANGRKLVGSGDIELSSGVDRHDGRDRPLLDSYADNDVVSNIHDEPDADDQEFDQSYGDMLNRASSFVSQGQESMRSALAKSRANSLAENVEKLKQAATSSIAAANAATGADKESGKGGLFSKDNLFCFGVFMFYAVSDSAKIIMSSLTMKDNLVNSQTLVVIVSVISIAFGFVLSLAIHGVKKT